jgi:peptide/nickel transport system ATP-binding protein
VAELRFEAVTVRYGTRRRGLTAVSGATLTVPDGTVVGLVGESGSGKSTLARAAVGLASLTSGRILLGDKPVPRRPGVHRPLQMIFQDPYSSLDPRMTVGATIAEAVPRGASGGDRKREVVRLLDLVGLEPERSRQLPGQLSGGQRQRVAVARALAGRPEVIIADEITSALDVSIQGTVLNLMRDLQRQLGLSMLFISHNLAVVRYVASSIAVMYLGRIVEYGSTADVLADPQHPYTRDLLAAIPDVEAAQLPERDPALRAVADAEPADPHHPPSGCAFHPRCPIGPVIQPDRDICRTTEPDTNHRHFAACHFVAASEPDGPPYSMTTRTDRIRSTP